MKVTDIKTFTVDCFRTNWVFVKVCTDEGITGVGEATLEYKEKALLGAVEHIREYMVGKDPLQYRDGFITIGDQPGLGIELCEEACLNHPYQPHTLRHYTGALTDIRPAKTQFYF